MIIATQTFLLSQPAAAPALTNPRILWRNRLANLLASAIDVSGETAEGPRDAPTRPNTDEYWEPPSLPAYIIFDMGQAYTINGIGIAGHNFGSTGTAVKAEAGTDPNFTSDALFAEERMPNDDASLLLLDADRIARYIKFTLTGTGAPIMAVAFAGECLAMEKAVSGPYRPISMARKTVLSGRTSRGGQFLGQNMRAHGLESDASFKNLSSTWVRSYFNDFSKHARSLPYFFAWNPQLLPLEVGYVRNEEADIVPTHNGNGLDMDVSWRMVGLGHE